MSGKQILLRRTGGAGPAFLQGRKGEVWHLVVSGAQYPSALRSHPPRVRLLEDQRDPFTKAELLDEWPELLDEWPDAPAEWPPLHPMGGLK